MHKPSVMTRILACLIAYLDDLHTSRTRRYNERHHQKSEKVS
jgi:hypothetical protein